MIRRNGDYIFNVGSDFSQNLANMVRCVPENMRAVPDQSPVQDFNFGESGWPMSDINALLAAQSDIEIERVAQRLTERKSKSNTDGLTDKEIIADILPRYVCDQASLFQYIYDRTVVDAPAPVEPSITEPAPEHAPVSE